MFVYQIETLICLYFAFQIDRSTFTLTIFTTIDRCVYCEIRRSAWIRFKSLGHHVNKYRHRNYPITRTITRGNDINSVYKMEFFVNQFFFKLIISIYGNK